jgi:hypothetical protein
MLAAHREWQFVGKALDAARTGRIGRGLAVARAINRFKRSGAKMAPLLHNISVPGPPWTPGRRIRDP